jgi:fatty acid desaturase
MAISLDSVSTASAPRPVGLKIARVALSLAVVAFVFPAVLIFRALTYAVPIPVGAFTYFIWHGKTSWRASTDQLQTREVPVSDFPIRVAVP